MKNKKKKTVKPTSSNSKTSKKKSKPGLTDFDKRLRELLYWEMKMATATKSEKRRLKFHELTYGKDKV